MELNQNQRTWETCREVAEDGDTQREEFERREDVSRQEGCRAEKSTAGDTGRGWTVEQGNGGTRELWNKGTAEQGNGGDELVWVH